MDCPICHAENQPDHKFCGACGHKMENDCPACGSANPPAYHFCGHCGHNLAASGMITLVRSGLIAEVDDKAAALVGHLIEEMTGKPFSLFVAREDLAVYFSHWNELLNTSRKQTLELALNHKKGKKVYVLMECAWDQDPTAGSQLIHLCMQDISDRRKTLDRLERQQNLLNLIYSLADNLLSVSQRYLPTTIVDGLKKICLFSKADHAFIYTINRSERRMVIHQQWCQPSSGGASTKFKSVPLDMLKRTVVRLLQKRSYIVNNLTGLPPAERYELLAWHHADLGAVMCHLIYRRQKPIGVIGLSRNRPGEAWDPDCVALVRLYGQLMSDALPFEAILPGQSVRNAFPPPKGSASQATSKMSGVEADLGAAAGTGAAEQLVGKGKKSGSPQSIPPAPGPLPDPGRPMQLEKISAEQAPDQQMVFLRDDGLILLTCPHCGFRESVALSHFEKLGNAVNVACPCRRRFSAVLEKRRAHRKQVQLEGYFTLNGEFGPNDAKDSIWGPMVVKNISKTGLRFQSNRVDLIRPGDYLMVRFNLDNSNKSLIHKQVQVVAIKDREVGCRFKGADEYDITLGFYFI